mgnify:FL=1
MRVPYRWIKEYCDIDASPLTFAHRITMTGTKCEGFENAADKIRNVVVGKVVSIERHPDSDHLWICRIDIGGETVQIVTGAQNVKAGDTVPAALHGSLLPNGAHIKRGKLRGVDSNGMLCSLGELGLTTGDFPECIENGIMILDPSLKAGTPIEKALALDDDVFEFEITSNRPDCLCAVGIAREAAATFNVPFKFRRAADLTPGGEAATMLTVDIAEPSLCYRYIGAFVRNVRIKPSPLWMRTRLRECGVRPINNIVDITNYVMLEYNQPMHAFDERNVKDDHIVVRLARPGETITTLDGVERELTDRMLIIADSEKPIAVAGVMGGEYSGIYDDTNTVIFESACFEGINNRATAKALGMRTDASTRYEKGLDPENTMPALARALELVRELDAGDVVDGCVDVRGDRLPVNVIKVSPARVNAFLGTDIPVAAMRDYLTRLDIGVSGPDEELTVVSPGWRRDVEAFADVSEEIARLYGYDNIPTTVMTGVATAGRTEWQKFLRAVTELCLAGGADEISTTSFMNPKALSQLRVPEDSLLRRAVRIINPFGEETSLLRTTAVGSMLDTLALNASSRHPAARLFEQATEYIADPDPAELPDERKKLIIGAYGEGESFYSIKGLLEALASMAHVSFDFVPCTDNASYHPGRCADVLLGGERIGCLGELHPVVLKNYGLKKRAYVADLDLKKLFDGRGSLPQYRGMPRFPALTRDLAIVCDKQVLCADIEAVIRRQCGAILAGIRVFDVYEGEQVPAGKKSIAFGLTLRSPERTLTDEEADSAVKKALAALAQLGAVLRS